MNTRNLLGSRNLPAYNGDKIPLCIISKKVVCNLEVQVAFRRFCTGPHYEKYVIAREE
jgi:hypothetical protein